mmetsp:Transcript_6282/g.9520  ORF Transcript_6282/g.9520 Transcript_6282/m.9520 type:complete len:201 (+) Transcript_6282:197-799(+)
MLKLQALITLLIINQSYISLVHAEGSHSHGHSEHESDIFCATECTEGNNADPCGDGKGQQESCTEGTSFITMFDKFGYSNQTALPNGFLGCSLHACEDLCMSAIMDTNWTEPMKVVTADDGVKTFCFADGNGMFMSKDLAEMSALTRGCSGSHFMDPMYKHGSNHAACVDSYHPDGSSSSRFTWSTIAAAVSLVLVTMMI